MANKPNIRFKGFTEDWEQRKFPEFVSFYNGLTYTPDDIQEMGTLVLRSSNVKNGEIVDADNVYVNDKVATSENVQVGDIIVVVRNGSRALIGKHAQIKASMPNTVIGAFMSGIRSGQSSFVNALRDASAFENEIAKNMGATINQITGYMFSKMEFMVPSEEEQQQIGQYFSNLDHLITLHQRKCDDTKKLKKYMLQKMFPKNGEKKPEIRFAGFTDDWEQRKFGELFSRRMERNLGQFDNTRWISVAKMYFQNPDKVTSNKIDTRTYVMHDGDIAFEGHPNQEYRFGRFVANDIGDGVISELFPIYQHITPYDNNYWKYAIQLEAIMAPKLLRCIEISYTSSNKLDEKFFLEEYTMVPTIEEQQKIGAYFSTLDHLITLHQRKCDDLKNLKKYMLQNMFV